MKTVWLCVLLCGLAWPAARAQGAPRAVWTLEKPSFAMLESRQVADEALSFLKRKRVTTVYLYADAFEGRNPILDRPGLYRDFIRRAHESGIQVYALLGSWYLHTERYVLPRHRREARAMLRRVLDYNTSVPVAERFDGVNYDIEPHLLAEWSDASRHRLLLGFLDMTADLMADKRKSGQSLSIGPAMPFWWDGITLEWNGARKTVAEHVIDATDYVALMDYRNRAEGRDSILSHAQDEMDYAERVGKRVVIGLEFNPSEPAKLSFHGMGEAAFEREAAKVENAYRGRSAFGGFVFHHYLGYRRFVDQSDQD